MKLAVIGSRTFNDYELLKRVFNAHFGFASVDTIVSGGAKGTDTLAKKLAQEQDFKYIEFLPDWDKWGKSAGPIRNKDIITNADFILCFWDGISAGSCSSLKLAKQFKKPALIYYI